MLLLPRDHCFPDMYRKNRHFKVKYKKHIILTADGKVTYQRKFLKSDTFLNNTTSGRITCNEFATAASPDPCKNIFQRYFIV
jgi:hypothetical protein